MLTYVEHMSLKESSSTQSLHTSIFSNYLHFNPREQNSLYIYFSHLQLKDGSPSVGSRSAFHKEKQSSSHFVRFLHTTHVPRIHNQ